MDFIFFKFIYEKHGKNLLIRRDDVSLAYLRLQTRQLYRMTQDKKFALSLEILSDREDSISPQGRLTYTVHPDKLLISDKQLLSIRKGKRKNHKDTTILITVHTDQESIK